MDLREMRPLEELMADLAEDCPEVVQRLKAAQSGPELQQALLSVFNLARRGSPREIRSEAPPSVQNRIRQFIDDNLHKGPSLKTLADFLGYSPKYCSEVFQLYMSESFSGYLRRVRLRKACTLLKDLDVPVNDVAASLGFSDSFAFSHFFKKATGLAPSQYRRRVRSRSALPSMS